jgi:hypothetical protein
VFDVSKHVVLPLSKSRPIRAEECAMYFLTLDSG